MIIHNCIWPKFSRTCDASMPGITRIVSTLCPKRLPPTDFVSLAGRVQPRLTLPRFGTVQLTYGGDPDAATRRLKPFPPDSHGFLYYYAPPKAPPCVGEIRFRLASDPDSFHTGKDLLSLNKIPWSLPLYALANRSFYAVFRNQLVYDGLVSPTVLEKWIRNDSELRSEQRRPAAMLYYLRQPFFLRFEKFHISFHTVTREDISFCSAVNFTREIRSGSGEGRFVIPYSGEFCLTAWRISLISHNNSAQEALWSDSNVTARTGWPCAFSKFWSRCKIWSKTSPFAVLRRGN